MSWTPVIVQSIMTIAIMVAIGIAVIGQVRWRATQEWEQLAEARLQRIQSMEQEIEALRRKGTADAALISELQRINLDLQRRMERLERTLNAPEWPGRGERLGERQAEPPEREG